MSGSRCGQPIPAIDAVTAIAPPSPSCGNRAVVSRIGASAFTRNTVLAGNVSATPALLNNASSVPLIRAADLSTASLSARSVSKNVACGPLGTFRSSTITSGAPDACRSSRSSAPTPVAPPVTTTRFPVKSMSGASPPFSNTVCSSQPSSSDLESWHDVSHLDLPVDEATDQTVRDVAHDLFHIPAVRRVIDEQGLADPTRDSSSLAPQTRSGRTQSCAVPRLQHARIPLPRLEQRPEE